MTLAEASGSLTLEDITALMEQMKETDSPVFSISYKTVYRLRKLYAIGQRSRRWQKIRKRQRRAQQRKHNRG